jgi:hypothetical protein
MGEALSEKESMEVIKEIDMDSNGMINHNGVHAASHYCFHSIKKHYLKIYYSFDLLK